MTDLQFKSFLKQLIARLEQAKDQETENAVKAEIDRILKDLRDDLQG